MSRILVVDDDAAIGRSLQLQLSAQGHEVRTYTSATEAMSRLHESTPEVALVDLRLPDSNGISLMGQILQAAPGCKVAIITGTQDMQATIQAIQEGAFDYLRKPLSIDDVLLVIEKAAAQEKAAQQNQRLLAVADEPVGAREIVGRDKAIVDVIKQIGLLSQSRVTVLILGETGTGKELVARAVHEAGNAGVPFVAINCSAVVPTLLESELFGHEQGAFTGAHARKLGKLEIAANGTVFFDEIADMPMDLQAKLLRVLQEREFCRVGGTEVLRFRARVLVATHHNIVELVEKGAFREDLYYRLRVATIRVPPLRDRRGDIPLLVEHLLSKINRELHKHVTQIPEGFMRRLESHDWPGNVRELENILTRAVALSTGETLNVEAVLGELESNAVAPEGDVPTLREIERFHVEKVLSMTGWNITRASAFLGISTPTLRKKIRDYYLKRPL